MDVLIVDNLNAYTINITKSKKGAFDCDKYNGRTEEIKDRRNNGFNTINSQRITFSYKYNEEHVHIHIFIESKINNPKGILFSLINGCGFLPNTKQSLIPIKDIYDHDANNGMVEKTMEYEIIFYQELG